MCIRDRVLRCSGGAADPDWARIAAGTHRPANNTKIGPRHRSALPIDLQFIVPPSASANPHATNRKQLSLAGDYAHNPAPFHGALLRQLPDARGAGFSALAMGRMMRRVVSKGISVGIKATHGRGLGTRRTTRTSATPVSYTHLDVYKRQPHIVSVS